MSQFCDPNKPFSFENWNNLIQAVNEILQNPEGTCEPVEPLAEVSDPHLWSEDDITAVRERLMETCPEISFSEPLELWRQSAIDEIEAEMQKAWCDCECEESRQLVWQAMGAISDANYTQEWVYLSALVGGAKIGAPEQRYEVEDIDLFNGWTRSKGEGTLNSTGTIDLSDQAVIMPIKQPVIFVPRWITPGSVYWHNYVDDHENLPWVDEVTNHYYLRLLCD